jgi:hypothetical protein
MAGASQSLEAAKEIAAQIDDKSDKLNAHLNLAVAQAGVKDTTGASQSLNVAKSIASQVGGTASDRARAFARIAACQAKTGDVASAKATAAQVKDEEVFHPLGYGNNDKDLAYAYIAIAELKSRDCAGAWSTAAKIKKENDLKAFLCYMVVAAEARVGDVRKAKLDTAMIEDGLFKLRAYVAIATAQGKAGDSAAAHETIAEAIKSLVSTTDDPRKRCEWVSTIVMALCPKRSEPLIESPTFPSGQQLLERELEEHLRSEVLGADSPDHSKT